MDILNPQFVWVDNRCYRNSEASTWSQGSKELSPYQEEDYDPIDCAASDDESVLDAIEIVPYRENQLIHKFHVNSHFYRFIIGFKGNTLKKLQTETSTKIKVPNVGKSGELEIIGKKERNIISARRRIDLLIETSRKKIDFTHFISLPVNINEVKTNFNKFKKNILEAQGSGVRGIKEEVFQWPESLHITIVVLVLLDEQDRKKAVEVLEDCKNNIILPIIKENGPIEIELRGVEIMNDDPSEVKVLYIKVHEEKGVFQKISNTLAKSYLEKGLSKEQYKDVKLHVTALNTKFLNEDSQKNRKNQKTFDATQILKEHQNTFFGRVQVSSLHLSIRHRVDKEGYYKTTAKVDF